ncbi:MAG: molecular chaperone DnaJ [Halorhodospira halophila]|uniref:molecular chaperone DnaJ n=1 Tax=Halorhodospira TaxID=85108 RepID=UPI001913CE6C|nr:MULTISPECIES: molecular chaperone DnaJ [Halorhodospira]MBK5935513.1 molecular chaperone DnaJ [Halorhodospira halophila]MBK5942473.1 molecular chaperone DnaJ [Halorhodospira halophila]MCC3750625.1 molecular chaperone DnaJ [Halorhodospira halophila]MCG5528254.1 molecular chaperone DnaJ [Halorhodospira halophila]MCG5532023.1 molecular chaperone DnaJ [Halorhodospira sp. 9621]
MDKTLNPMPRPDLEHADPYLCLGVERDADDAAIHAAYLAAVRACPPERDARRFEALRQAYQAIRTERLRLAQELFDTRPATAIDLLDRAAPTEAPGRPDEETFRAVLGPRGKR